MQKILRGLSLILVLMVPACGGESDTPSIPVVPPIPPETVWGFVQNDDATQYRVYIATWDSATAAWSYVDLANPTTMGPSFGSGSCLLQPSSATIHHYVLVNTMAYAYVDRSTNEFIKGPGMLILHVGIGSGMVIWSTNGGSTWYP